MAKAPADLRSLARGYTGMCIKTLGTIAQRGKSESARVAAVALLLERGWGKAPTTFAGADGEGDVRVVVRHILEGSSMPRPLGRSDNSRVAIEHDVLDRNGVNSVIK